MGMVTNGTNRHDSQGAVFGSMRGDDPDEPVGRPCGGGCWPDTAQKLDVNCRPRERAVHGRFTEPVGETWAKPGRAGRCPSQQKHTRRRHKGDDELMNRDAVPCLEKLQLMNEAKVEVCSRRRGSPRTNAEKEVVREKVAEVVGWFLSGIAARDTSLAEIRRDGNAQAEGLVPGQDSTRQQVAQVERHRT